MADTDLSAKFEQISDRARAATDELKAAGDSTRNELETDAAKARDRATAAADQLKAKADTARDDASSQWQAIHNSCTPTWPKRGHASKTRRQLRRAPGRAGCRPGGGLCLQRNHLRAERDRRSRVRDADCHVCASQRLTQRA